MGLALLNELCWFAALLGPPYLALWFWIAATGREKGWLNHLLFLPSVLGLQWFAVRGMFFAAGDVGEGPPGLGIMLVVPATILAASVTIYYIALGARFITSSFNSKEDNQ